MDFIRTENLPEDTQLSDDLKQRAEFFGVIQLFGISYYIPVTKEMKKLFDIKNRNGMPYFVNHGFSAADFIRDLIASVYYQIRETVGAEVYSDLSSEISREFTKLFSHGLMQTITQRLEDKTGQKNQVGEDTILHDGFSKLVLRGDHPYEVLEISDSVAVLIWDSTSDQVILTRQYRAAMKGSLTEVVAGRFDEKIGVKGLVVKEVKEEIGVTITEGQVSLLNEGKPLAMAPGILTERCYLAYAEVDSSMIETGNRVFGLHEEGERIERVIVPVKHLDRVVYEDMKTFALIHYFLRERVRRSL